MALPPPDSRLGRTAIVASVCGIVALALWTVAIRWRPSVETYLVQGVDAGEGQGTIDWPTIAAGGADFAYLRATAGADGRDAHFAANWSGVGEAGMRRGAMHVWSFCASPTDQANNFNTNVPRADDALPAAVAIDFVGHCAARPDRTAVVAAVKRFVEMVEAHTGKPVLLKISEPVEAVYHLSSAIERPLWSSRNFFAPDYAARPWRMWQASNLRRVDGIDGPVHWDVVAP